VRFLPFVDDVLVLSNAVANPILVADRTGRNGKLQLREIEALPEVTRRLASGGS